MLAIIFNQGINVMDVVERPLYRDYYQVKTEKVLLDGIENAIYLGLLWVEPQRVLGTFGIVKILRSGLDADKSQEGKYAVTLGYSKK
ncbi:MAG: zinc-binding alcohol dehydrogenase family protein, partial [Sulfolobaceae archaeon]